MDKKTAIALLDALITRGKGLKQGGVIGVNRVVVEAPKHRELRERWRLDCRATLERVFGKDSRQLTEYAKVEWTPGIYGPDKAVQNQREIEAWRVGLRRSLTILESALNEVEQFWELDRSIVSIDPLHHIARLCERFHVMAIQLRHRRANRAPLEFNDEYDVQYLFHALLLLNFDEVEPEEFSPSFAGASSRMDFLMKREQIVLEVKRTRKGLGAKEVGEELIVDCQRYKVHPDCKMLVCFVYDPEQLVANPRGVENDLATAGGELPVKVFIRP